VERVKELLGQIGLESDRVRMFNMSSAMAGQFAEAAKEMTEQVAKLGPNPLREPDPA
jgi:coenzyme F420-reducing hydrogenase delta subunit